MEYLRDGLERAGGDVSKLATKAGPRRPLTEESPSQKTLAQRPRPQEPPPDLASRQPAVPSWAAPLPPRAVPCGLQAVPCGLQPGCSQNGVHQPGMQQPGMQQPGFQQPGFQPGLLRAQPLIQSSRSLASSPGLCPGLQHSSSCTSLPQCPSHHPGHSLQVLATRPRSPALGFRAVMAEQVPSRLPSGLLSAAVSRQSSAQALWTTPRAATQAPQQVAPGSPRCGASTRCVSPPRWVASPRCVSPPRCGTGVAVANVIRHFQGSSEAAVAATSPRHWAVPSRCETPLRCQTPLQCQTPCGMFIPAAAAAAIAEPTSLANEARRIKADLENQSFSWHPPAVEPQPPKVPGFVATPQRRREDASSPRSPRELTNKARAGRSHGHSKQDPSACARRTIGILGRVNRRISDGVL